MSIHRKIKRKQQLKMFKDFKKSMKKFKKAVHCSVCQRFPREGEKIDDWHINKDSENIGLCCVECYEEVLTDV